MNTVTNHRPSLMAWGLAAIVMVSVLAACGSSGSGKAATGTTTPTASGQSATVSAAQVGDFGTVLVSSKGLTLYILTSEAGGKVTCTSGNGCASVWPAVQLPSGVTSATAGSGVKASLLGTVAGSGGGLLVTYAGYPLYTYVGDSGSGQSNGFGITSFGGTWYPISASGALVKASVSAGSSPTSGSPSGPGY